MKKLGENDVKALQAFKGVEKGYSKFFDYMEEYYADDPDTLARIKECRAMRNSLDTIETFPAYMKTQTMFYEQMDALLFEAGYQKAQVSDAHRTFAEKLKVLVEEYDAEVKKAEEEYHH